MDYFKNKIKDSFGNVRHTRDSSKNFTKILLQKVLSIFIRISFWVYLRKKSIIIPGVFQKLFQINIFRNCSSDSFCSELFQKVFQDLFGNNLKSLL